MLKNLYTQPINNHCSRHIETGRLIRTAYQLTGFFMIGTSVVNKLKNSIQCNPKLVVDCKTEMLKFFLFS